MKVREVVPDRLKEPGRWGACFPCIRGDFSGWSGVSKCDQYEVPTAEEIAEYEAEQEEDLKDLFEREISPCCKIPIEKRESERTTVAYCPHCGVFLYRSCRRIGESCGSDVELTAKVAQRLRDVGGVW